MPATSIAQRRAMAIAEHSPGKLYKRNQGLLAMGKEKLHEFAATSEKGLSKRAKRRKAAMLRRRGKK